MAMRWWRKLQHAFMFPVLWANAKIKLQCNLRVCPHLWLDYGLLQRYVGICVSAKTSWLAQQCDSERGISANIWPSGGAKVSSTCWCHYCKMGVTFTKARPSQHPNTVKKVERGGREADKEEREWITHLGECKWLILMFCSGWCGARSFMSALLLDCSSQKWSMLGETEERRVDQSCNKAC